MSLKPRTKSCICVYFRVENQKLNRRVESIRNENQSIADIEQVGLDTFYLLIDYLQEGVGGPVWFS